MARRALKQLDGLPRKKFDRLVRLLNAACPNDPAKRQAYFQAIRQAASRLQASGNLGLLDQLNPFQLSRLKNANAAQRSETSV